MNGAYAKEPLDSAKLKRLLLPQYLSALVFSFPFQQMYGKHSECVQSWPDSLLKRLLKKRVLLKQSCGINIQVLHDSLNPLRPNSDGSQTSHCNIKDLSGSQVMRIENMITQVQFY